MKRPKTLDAGRMVGVGLGILAALCIASAIPNAAGDILMAAVFMLVACLFWMGLMFREE